MAKKVLSDGGPDGTVVGQSAADLIHLYGGDPVAQRSSTVLATSLLSASSYVTVAANTAAILLEMSRALIALGVYRTTA
jgi:hypothetical protein